MVMARWMIMFTYQIYDEEVVKINNVGSKFKVDRVYHVCETVKEKLDSKVRKPTATRCIPAREYEHINVPKTIHSSSMVLNFS